jgi:pentatricopeptide repeat protein
MCNHKLQLLHCWWCTNSRRCRCNDVPACTSLAGRPLYGWLTALLTAALILQRLVPEPRTFNIVMNACNAAGQFASCVAVHGRMASQKVPPTVGTYNAVVLAHCK